MIKKVIALDLFCGAGGASMGLYNAGFEVSGVDINPQKNYPFSYIIKDVTKLSLKFLRQYDFIWASPPCQAYSQASRVHRNKGKKYPDLIGIVRKKLQKSGRPYCIENVFGAPLQFPVMLCGTMFGLGVFRHRYFETSFGLLAPEHIKHKGKIGDGKYFSIAGGAGRWKSWGKVKRNVTKGTVEQWRKALDIEWMTRKELTQAIPPAYSEYIAKQFLANQSSTSA